VFAGEIRVPINSDQDIVLARQKGKTLAADAGFSPVDCTLVATAISELARNIVSYAKKGEIALQLVRDSRRSGILIIASDDGPGIADLRLALRDGFSTSGSLGLGLPGVRRLVDEFQISSSAGQGTVVKVTKWRLDHREK
jgi:serine/threonine-protein kinase RsbT